MVAIITDVLKKQLAQTLLDEFDDSSADLYYVGLGASEQWDSSDTPPTPTNTEREIRQFRYKMASMKKIADASFVIPRYNWTSGTTYSAYNDNSVSQGTRYYVVTSENNVYVCIRQGKDTNGNAVTSTVQPTGTSATVYNELQDGYIWKYLYTISAADALSFLTASYMPVQYIDSAALGQPYYSQYLVQQNAKAKNIIGYRVTNAGSGYTGATSVTVTGNGKGAHARVVLTASNTVGAVEVDDSSNGFPIGSGYDYASVTISGPGSNATAVPIFSNPGGIGANPVLDLRARAINFSVQASGDEQGVFLTEQDFRQIGLFKNPKTYGANTLYTGTTGKTLRVLTLSGTDDFEADQVVTSSGGAKAYIDFYLQDSAGDPSPEIWYHQTEATGFKAFAASETLSTSTATNSVSISSLDSADIDPFSGDLLYIDNRPLAITRSEEQTEDIKIIVQL